VAKLETSSGIIDCQTHYIGPEALRVLEGAAATGCRPAGLPRAPGAAHPMTNLEARLAAMEEAGIRVSLLGFAPVGLIDDPGLRTALCRAANDDLAAACAAFPDRFVMAGCLPLPDPEAALAELERIAGTGALRAVQIVAQTTHYRPDELGIDPLLGRIAAEGLPLILHPAAGVADLAPQFEAFGLSSGMHAMVSHALVAARMIQSGLLDRIPDLVLIVTHLGGILPFLIDRLDSRAAGPALHAPSHYLRHRILVDACSYPAGPALRCALETIGPDRIVLGSDWPSRPIAPALAAIRGLALPPEVEAGILGGTAARWFDPKRPRLGLSASFQAPIRQVQ